MIQLASKGFGTPFSLTIKSLFQAPEAGRFDDFGFGLLEAADSIQTTVDVELTESQSFTPVLIFAFFGIDDNPLFGLILGDNAPS